MHACDQHVFAWSEPKQERAKEGTMLEVERALPLVATGLVECQLPLIRWEVR
jgi:hypothetical protein